MRMSDWSSDVGSSDLMDQIRVHGGRRLHGRLPISGAKNAALPLMAAALLTGEPLRLLNVPRLADIASMASLMRQHGVRIDRSNGLAGGGSIAAGVDLTLSADDIVSTVAPYDLVRKMRASVLVLGPLLARFGEATVSLPGGCAIGNPPLHLPAPRLYRVDGKPEAAERRADRPQQRACGWWLDLSRGRPDAVGRRHRQHRRAL